MSGETGRNLIRARVVYHGRVQGVFFRATAREIAQRHAVVGYVRNCPDGTVELEAEGPVGEVESFLAELAAAFAGYITGADRGVLPPLGREVRFEIRY